VFVLLNPNYRSTGGIADHPDYPADSFFNVYVTVDILAIGSEGLWHSLSIRIEAYDITDIPP